LKAASEFTFLRVVTLLKARVDNYSLSEI